MPVAKLTDDLARVDPKWTPCVYQSRVTHSPIPKNIPTLYTHWWATSLGHRSWVVTLLIPLRKPSNADYKFIVESVDPNRVHVSLPERAKVKIWLSRNWFIHVEQEEEFQHALSPRQEVPGRLPHLRGRRRVWALQEERGGQEEIAGKENWMIWKSKGASHINLSGFVTLTSKPSNSEIGRGFFSYHAKKGSAQFIFKHIMPFIAFKGLVMYLVKVLPRWKSGISNPSPSPRPRNYTDTDLRQFPAKRATADNERNNLQWQP